MDLSRIGRKLAAQSKGRSSRRGRFVRRERVELPWGYAEIGDFVPNGIAQILDVAASSIPDGRRVVVVVSPDGGTKWEKEFNSDLEAHKYIEELRQRATPAG